MSEADTSTNGHPTLNHEQSSLTSNDHTFITSQSQSVKRKVDPTDLEGPQDVRQDKRRKGTAPIKEEFLVKHEAGDLIEPKPERDEADDDAAEAFHHEDRKPAGKNNSRKPREKNQGQNKARHFGTSRDEVGLCSSRNLTAEFSPSECPYGAKCKFDHDLRTYLKEHKRADLTTFNGLCPVYEAKGRCDLGWKCRFVGSHSKEVEHPDGRKELVLVENPYMIAKTATMSDEDEMQTGVANILSAKSRFSLSRRLFPTPKSDVYIPSMDTRLRDPNDQGKGQNQSRNGPSEQTERRNSSSPEPEGAKEDHRAGFVEPPVRPSEKRRLYFGPETPLLAPLTTQGNLPFRRLCSSLGAVFTYSEMAMSMPILQGQKSEWALMKAHESDVLPPTFTPNKNIVYDYDQSADLRFGAQISASKPWLAIKATEVLTTLLPTGLRVVDLNCGCPIDLVYREGAGSALMDSPGKLEKMLRGMNAVSGPVPVTVKIRTGTRDKQPTAQKLVDRLVLGAGDSRGNACGVAAITLHGRSRQQRYSRSADWEYITSTASLIKNLNERADAMTDTVHEPDERDLANGQSSGATGRRNKVFFIGNGDVYSHENYNDHIQNAGVDAVMAARGALVKPWLFEEIQTNQYLDKSSSERLRYIEQFCRFGLEAWGSDEMGVGQTRRFLLEWLSFACRYVPIGLLEYLPPNLQDRPPAYRGRDDLETLMASDNYKDWIKIRYVDIGCFRVVELYNMCIRALTTTCVNEM